MDRAGRFRYGRGMKTNKTRIRTIITLICLALFLPAGLPEPACAVTEAAENGRDVTAEAGTSFAEDFALNLFSADPEGISGISPVPGESGTPVKIAYSVIDPPKMIEVMDVEVLYAAVPEGAEDEGNDT